MITSLFFQILRINRIRLEFKEELMLGTSLLLCCINRIRLEFKVMGYPSTVQQVIRINRIRLEFKVNLSSLFNCHAVGY